MRILILFVSTLVLLTFNSAAQEFKTPRPSPDATVSQYVGITKITVDYSRPGVKGRTIWGDLVPYGKIWRTGANEVTSINFSDAVKVNNNELPAGTYGVHTIPGESEWEIIFSNNTKIDDGSNYDASKDALRIKVKPEANPFTERMAFTFTDMTDNSANVNLTWENLKVSFKVEVSTQELTLQSARNLADWGMLMSAANYCLQRDVNLEEGFKWIKASVLIKEVYWNTRVLAQFQNKLGMKEKAISTMEKAIELGGKMKSAPFDYDRMKDMLADWKK